MELDFLSVIKYLETLTSEVFRACFENCRFSIIHLQNFANQLSHVFANLKKRVAYLCYKYSTNLCFYQNAFMHTYELKTQILK